MTRLRLAFMGTPVFALKALEALVEAGHDIACVYTRAPKPAGRGQKEQLTPVHRFAETRGLTVRTPQSLKDDAEQRAFAALGLDVAVVVAYGLILPAPILDAPRLGCLNIHGSLLPRWRGAAPIQRAIMAGDAETGVMIMKMDEGLDTGPVLSEARLALPPRATAGWAHDQLADMGAALIVETLCAYADGTISPHPQPQTGVTYAAKITRADTHIDWTHPAVQIDAQVRGLSPAPGAWFDVSGERIKLLDSEPVAGGGAPGEVLDDALTVACGDGALRLLTLQRAGRAPMAAADFSRGFALPRGTRLG